MERHHSHRDCASTEPRVGQSLRMSLEPKLISSGSMRAEIGYGGHMRVLGWIAARRQRKAHERYKREREREAARRSQNPEESVKETAEAGLGIGTHNP